MSAFVLWRRTTPTSNQGVKQLIIRGPADLPFVIKELNGRPPQLLFGGLLADGGGCSGRDALAPVGACGRAAAAVARLRVDKPVEDQHQARLPGQQAHAQRPEVQPQSNTLTLINMPRCLTKYTLLSVSRT